LPKASIDLNDPGQAHLRHRPKRVIRRRRSPDHPVWAMPAARPWLLIVAMVGRERATGEQLDAPAPTGH
jgi:hypothetical protein